MQIPITDRELFILKKIAKAAQDLAVETYVIGGFVRNKILGLPVKDADIVCIGDGVLLAEKVAEQFNPKPTVAFFKNFGTAQIKLHDYEIEFVGARKESYRRESRKPEVVPGTFADDIARRDFTINTLAISLQQENYGELVDYYNGIIDLENKCIKTPLEPETTFSDDPLRMMRAIRFASQLQFNIHEDTLQGIRNMKERIEIVSKERITDELNKIILSKKPSIGFALLYETGLLQIIFPEMHALSGAEFIDGRGHKDNFWHTLQVLDNVAVKSKDLWLRWAAILHDIAKPPTKRFDKKVGFTFHGHEVVGAKMTPKIFKALKLPMQDNMRFVQKMVLMHLRPISLTKESITDSAVRRLLFDAGDDLESLMMLCDSDITSKNPQKVRRFLENFELVRQKCADLEERDKIRTWQPPITGEIIMDYFGLTPSKLVGDIKTAIREAMLDGVIAATKEDGLQLMHEIGLQKGLIKK
jgi:poly(A) polymerase